MDTEYVLIGEGEERREQIKKAAGIIKNGGLVAFPTETVYGLGGNGLNPSSSEKIYEAKGRPSDNPLILHISDLSMLEGLIEGGISEAAKKLAKAYWPGPMTLVFKKAPHIPLETTGGLQTVAVRLPNNEIARELIREANVPIAAPSANTSGRPSPTSAHHVKADLDGRIDMILDGGDVGIGLESTIIDLTEETPIILRPGFITLEMLGDIFSEVRLDSTILMEKMEKDLRPKAPGMKYKHYAPKGKLVIYEGEVTKVIEAINEKTELAKKAGRLTAVLATEETKDLYVADYVYSLGKRTKAKEIAHNLFRVLRELDEVGAEEIFSESFTKEGFYTAIMNRLLKAAGYSIVKL